MRIKFGDYLTHSVPPAELSDWRQSIFKFSGSRKSQCEQHYKSLQRNCCLKN